MHAPGFELAPQGEFDNPGIAEILCGVWAHELICASHHKFEPGNPQKVSAISHGYQTQALFMASCFLQSWTYDFLFTAWSRIPWFVVSVCMLCFCCSCSFCCRCHCRRTSCHCRCSTSSCRCCCLEARLLGCLLPAPSVALGSQRPTSACLSTSPEQSGRERARERERERERGRPPEQKQHQRQQQQQQKQYQQQQQQQQQ
jgi:hypothetical protein